MRKEKKYYNYKQYDHKLNIHESGKSPARGTIVNDTEKKNLANKYGGWERLVIFIGVILTVIIFTFMATAIVGLFQGREGQGLGIALSVIVTLILWVLVWGALWVITGFRSGTLVPQTATKSELDEVIQENARLRQQLEKLSQRKEDSR